MPAPILPDEEFMEMFESLGASKMARYLSISERSIYNRRKRLENFYRVKINSSVLSPEDYQDIKANRKARIRKEVKDGQIIVFSDAHYWPQLISTAHGALLEIANEIKPQIIIANGDIFDGASQSRHSRINWEEVPGTAPELWACQSRLAEIEGASPDSERIWTLGNHDARFESYIANNAPELAKVHGVHLKDHFPNWTPCWSVVVNEGSAFPITIKHRWKGGVGAARNNALNARRSFVSGHTHQMNAAPLSAFENDTIFGIEMGTLAEPFGPQFEAYTEDNPRNWVSGFGVLTIVNGQLLWPQFVRTLGKGIYEYRGEIRELGSDKRKNPKGPKRVRTTRKRNG